MVWPQHASELLYLSREERRRGMRVLAKAIKGKKPALILGVQAATKEDAVEYAELAEELSPDAVIAMPPTGAKSLDDYRDYYRTLSRITKRPFFIQTTGGAPDVDPTVDFLIELARELPNFGYVKEGYMLSPWRIPPLKQHSVGRSSSTRCVWDAMDACRRRFIPISMCRSGPFITREVKRKRARSSASGY
jgi:hypothetical protein